MDSQNNNILSDEAVSNILKEHYNILISRRTVAKYRESMKIPSSAIRKRLRKMSVQK